jgi:hypothetical protein
MAGWRASREVRPLEPVLDYAVLTLGAVAGPLAVVAVVVGLAVWLTRPSTVATVGADLRDWCLCYAAYLVAVLESVSSLPRYLLPLFPLGTLLVAASPSRAYRVTLVVASAAAGLVWLAVVWRSRGVAP